MLRGEPEENDEPWGVLLWGVHEKNELRGELQGEL